jgi:signal transduction histidine kinase
MEQLADPGGSVDPSAVVLQVVQTSSSDADVKRWLARELHDSVVQSLSLMVLEMDQFKLRRPRRARDARQVERLEALARNALSSLRETIHELRGDQAGEAELVPCVSLALERLERDIGIRATLSVAPSWPPSFSWLVTRNLARVIDEALSNVRSHSAAKQVTVSMRTAGESALVSVQDDGRGFDPDGAGSGLRIGGLGLIGMRERALLIGGSLRLDSAPGQGTKLSLAFPIRGV